jgi:hypothetical protein
MLIGEVSGRCSNSLLVRSRVQVYVLQISSPEASLWQFIFYGKYILIGKMVTSLRNNIIPVIQCLEEILDFFY